MIWQLLLASSQHGPVDSLKITYQYFIVQQSIQWL